MKLRSASGWVAIVAIAAVATEAWGKPADDDDVTIKDDQPSKPKKAKKPADDDGGGDDAPIQKQDLNGHDLGTNKKENVFERDRFFVDKTDSDRTAKGTLVQGSLTSTTFGYMEFSASADLKGRTTPPVKDG